MKEADLLPDKRDVVFEALLVDAEEQFGYDRLVMEHASLPELHKYRYVFGQGNTSTKGTTETNEFVLDHDINKEGQKALRDGKANGNLEIKIEHESHVELKAQIVCCKSAKTALDKALSQAQDTIASLEAAAVIECSLKPKAVIFGEQIKDVVDFLVQLRQLVAEAETCKNDAAELPDVLDKCKKAVQAASAHNDGLKDKTKAMKKLI